MVAVYFHRAAIAQLCGCSRGLQWMEMAHISAFSCVMTSHGQWAQTAAFHLARQYSAVGTRACQSHGWALLVDCCSSVTNVCLHMVHRRIDSACYWSPAAFHAASGSSSTGSLTANRYATNTIILQGLVIHTHCSLRPDYSCRSHANRYFLSWCTCSYVAMRSGITF